MNLSSHARRAFQGLFLLFVSAILVLPQALPAQEKTAKERQEEALRRIQERMEELKETEFQRQEEVLQRVQERLNALQSREMAQAEHQRQALHELQEAQAQHRDQAMQEAKVAYERALEMYAQEGEEAASRARKAFQEAQEIIVRMGTKIRLGVELDGSQGEEYDGQGALLRGVIDDSPADEAGLREGDIITHLNGNSLLDPLRDAEEEDDLDQDESLPVQRLMALARDLEPGDEVEIRYLRDGQTEAVTFEAAEIERPGVWVLGDEFEGRGLFRVDPDREGVWHFRMPEGRALAFRTPRFDSTWAGRFHFDSLGVGELEFDTLNFGVLKLDSLGAFQRLKDLDLEWNQGPRRLAFRYGGDRPFFPAIYNRFGFEGMELQDLNPDLAEYFSTDQGVLVLDVDEDSELGLRAGDVIQSIGGRSVEDIGDVRRILDSYEDGEAVTFQVMRRGQVASVEGVVG